MNVLKESSEYLEKKVDLTKNEIDEIEFALKSLDIQGETLQKRKEDVESFILSRKDDYKIFSLFTFLGVSLSILLSYYINYIFLSGIILFIIYFSKNYIKYNSLHRGYDQEIIHLDEKMNELDKSRYEYCMRMDRINKKHSDYRKGLAGEKIVSQMLKSLGPGNYLINDVMLYEPLGNIDHILVSPHGIFVIETKNWDGNIECDGDDWLSHFERGNTSIDYPLESLSARVKGNSAKLSHLLETKLFQSSMEIWVDGIIVFVNPNIKLSIKDSQVPVVKVENLCKYVTHQMPKINYSSRDLESIANFLQKELVSNKDSIACI